MILYVNQKKILEYQNGLFFCITIMILRNDTGSNWKYESYLFNYLSYEFYSQPGALIILILSLW